MAAPATADDGRPAANGLCRQSRRRPPVTAARQPTGWAAGSGQRRPVPRVA